MISLLKYLLPFLRKTSDARPFLFLGGNGGYDVSVAGTSKYQAFLNLRAGGRQEFSARVLCYADLFCEDGNPADENAVRVEIEGNIVGYLPRELCPTYRAEIAALGIANKPVFCRARIIGGWVDDESSGHFGVRLNMARPLKLRKAPDRK